jgi:hypothetical protein
MFQGQYILIITSKTIITGFFYVQSKIYVINFSLLIKEIWKNTFHIKKMWLPLQSIHTSDFICLWRVKSGKVNLKGQY